MRKSSLRKTTLLSLLGISSAQTSSWGEPFAVDPAATTSSSSTDNLIPPASSTPTWGDAFSVDNSAVVTPTSSLPTSDATAPSLAVDTASPVPLNPATSDVTVISGIQSVVASRSASFDTSASTQSATGTSSGSAAAEATGAAAPARGFKKMGLAGAIAGAAGVMFM